MYLGLVFFIKYSVKGLYKVLCVGTVNPTVFSIMLIIYGAPTSAIKLTETNAGFRVILKPSYLKSFNQVAGCLYMYIIKCKFIWIISSLKLTS